MMSTIIEHNKMSLIGYTILSLINGFIIVLASFLFSAIINSLTGETSVALTQNMLILTSVWIIRILFGFVLQRVRNKISYTMSYQVRSSVADKILSMSLNDFKKDPSGNYISWYTNDVAMIDDKIIQNIFALIDGTFVVIFAFISLIVIHWIVSVTAIVVLLISVSLPSMMQQQLTKQAGILSKKQESYSQSVSDIILGYAQLYLFNSRNIFRERTKYESSKVETAKKNYRDKEAAAWIIIGIVSVLSQISLVLVTAYLAAKNLTEIGSVFAVASLGGMFYTQLEMTVERMMAMKSSEPILAKFNIDKLSNHEGKSHLGNITSIRFENAGFSFDDKQVISNFSAEFLPNKKYAIVGQSGSGKTTLINLILKLYTDFQGKIFINNEDISNLSAFELYDQIALVDQTNYIYNDTIRNNITLWHNGFTDDDIWNVLRKVNLVDRVSEFDNGLGEVITDKGGNMSGGERQRICIARALLRDKKVIIVDEGTSSLDKKNAEEIEKILLGIPILLIYISHHLSNESISRFDEVIDLNI